MSNIFEDPIRECDLPPLKDRNGNKIEGKIRVYGQSSIGTYGGWEGEEPSPDTPFIETIVKRTVKKKGRVVFYGFAQMEKSVDYSCVEVIK